MKKYCIIRFFQFGVFKTLKDGTTTQVINEIRETGLTLEEARAHCNDPSTRGPGWFDGYDEEAKNKVTR